MNTINQPWNRLVAVAHQAPEDAGSLAAPLGFATRVAALWRAERMGARAIMVWNAFAVPAFAVAALLAVGAVLMWGMSTTESRPAAELVALADPMVNDSMLP